MEEHVGMISNNPNYKLEELEKQYASDTMHPHSAEDPSITKNYTANNEDGGHF